MTDPIDRFLLLRSYDAMNRDKHRTGVNEMTDSRTRGEYWSRQIMQQASEYSHEVRDLRALVCMLVDAAGGEIKVPRHIAMMYADGRIPEGTRLTQTEDKFHQSQVIRLVHE